MHGLAQSLLSSNLITQFESQSIDINVRIFQIY